MSFDQAFLLKDGRVFVVMEYLEGIYNLNNLNQGGNLKEFIEERKEANQEITDYEKSVILK